MKNNSIYILFILLVIGTSSCSNYEAQFEGPYNEESETSAEAKVVVFVVDGNVLLANAVLQDIETIDNSGEVDVVSINNAHTKVIFKRENGNIQIYDIKEERITDEVPNSGDATWFDFHANNETIFFQTDWTVSTYGPEVIPNNIIDIKSIYPVFVDGNILRGVTMLENGGFIYSVEITPAVLSLNYYDGQENVFQLFNGSIRKHLRLDEEETTLWTSNLAESNVSFHDVTTLDLTGGTTAASFATPVDSDSGFLIIKNWNASGNQAILLPGTTLGRVFSGGQEVSSIDY